MQYTLQNLAIADYDEVLALWQRTEGVGLNESDTREGIALFLERNRDLSFVARDAKGRIIGAVLCGHDGRRGYLHHLAVEKACRGQGIGRALVENCLARLRALGILKCNIFLYANNDPGRAFWERLGWAQRVDLCVLQKPLKP
ncbi:MAG: GNAT family N-acetyltransferase [Verrucomicrobiota bacterium]